MGEYINDIFARGDLQQIRSFLLTGAEESSQSDESYHVRLKQASDPIYKRIDSLYTAESELTPAVNELVAALGTHQEVYMEIGMKTGARLLHQLLLTDNPLNGGQL